MVRVLAVPLLALLVFAPVAAAPRTSRPAAATTPPPVAYRAPVEPVRVLRGFEPPPSPYGAGHRGVDLAVRPGQPVRAAAAGLVTFAGSVAGRGVVVIAHPDGVSTEYEPLAPGVTAGAALSVGAVIGRVAGTHAGCAPAACLHWGARRDGHYFDPLTLLRPLGPVRLLPWPDTQPDTLPGG
jgi:murein DD-endopeptidase MepM/ murein hydrolase activator NlpD